MKPKDWILLLILTCAIYVSIKNAAHFIKTYNNLDKQGIAESTILHSDNENEILKKLGKKAKAFAIKNNYNNSYCFLLNMKLYSDKKRFFIYDLAHDRIVNSGMVAHGVCNKVFLSEVRFSNENGSGCTSEGRYIVGQKYKGRFGNGYKLKGLDAKTIMRLKGLSCYIHMIVCQTWKNIHYQFATVLAVQWYPIIFYKSFQQS